MSAYANGIYRDLLTGPGGRELYRSPWRRNKVVADCGRLNAALMKGDRKMRGILFWAVGAGWKRWDGNLPVPSPDDVKLAREVTRQPILVDNILYIDDDDKPSRTPTSRVEVTAVFKGSDFASEKPGRRVLREFGLFGGDATQKADSGLMIDYVVHPRIDMHEDLTLTRKLRLDFGRGFEQQPRPLGFGTGIDVVHIDGIGEVFGKTLVQRGIRFIDDLLKIPHWETIGTIPRIKLVEFCAKARMVTGLAVDLSSFGALGSLNVTTVTGENPEKLLEMTRSTILTLEDIVDMQHRLSALQVALDDGFLQKLTIMDLYKGGNR